MHTQTGMSLQRLWAGAALLALALIANPAAAQSTGGTGGAPFGIGSIRVQVQTIGGAEVRRLPGTQVFVGIDACRNDAPVVFRLLDILPAANSIDVYSGEDCNTSSRVTTTGGGCRFLTTETLTQTANLDVTVPASALFKRDASDADPCGAGVQDTLKLWFLPVNQSQSSEAVSVYGLYVDLVADSEAPEPPRGLTAGSAEIINVNWDPIAGQENLDKIVIYIDPELDAAAVSVDADAGATLPELDEACPSRALIAGQAAPVTPPEGILTQEVDASLHKFTLEPGKLGLGRNPSAIAVAAVDKAGNRSTFSQVVCASAIPTQDFWESYRDNGGADVEGCPCAALGTTQLRGSWPIGLAFLMMVVSARRRRTR